MTFDEIGPYILEINDAAGAAVINTPVYTGDVYPLIPDFRDLSPELSNKELLQEPRLIGDRRQLVLNLINKVRSTFGAQNIYGDQGLDSLAQNYSEAQISGNFFGHYDLQGRSPDARAKAAGIEERVG